MAIVTVKIVSDELEAEIACALLRAEDIRCAHRKSDFAAGASGGLGEVMGPRAVLVHEADLERARALLDEADGVHQARG